eukprot:GHVS01025440.1.p1 GENE.GHVS01025440.1~~GHVS01025440.1.p1  ORF type:complete len:145 (+),score=23.79 GHVS01025440.1:280-714(+)
MDSWGYRILVGIVVAGTFLFFLHSIEHNFLPQPATELFRRTQFDGWAAEASAWLGPYSVHAKYAGGALAACAICLCFSLFVQRLSRERQQTPLGGGVSYCVNQMTDEQFRDKSFTRQSVMELINSPEYQKVLREQKKKLSVASS